MAVAAGVDIERWSEQFDTAFAWIAGRFGRPEPRRQARSFLLGLLSDVDTRSCWQLAERPFPTCRHPGAGDRPAGPGCTHTPRGAIVSGSTWQG